MGNTNETFKWWQNEMNNKIVVEDVIIDWEKPIRGIYGIFICDDAGVYCAYIGRTSNMYSRFFTGNDGHLVKIKNGECENEAIKKALRDEKATIKIKVLEEVECQYDNYFKDMQRLALAENYHISKYQELNQCLEQLPDGSNMDKSVWEQAAKNCR